MSRLAAAVLAFYRREPARVHGLLASLLFALMARYGWGIEQVDVEKAVVLFTPILAAELTRRLVTPTVHDGIVTEPVLIVGESFTETTDWQPSSPDAQKPQA